IPLTTTVMTVKECVQLVSRFGANVLFE
ncbi:hypothetical protein Trydic_g18614, partial [Trypoxylus dichotomus]